MNSAEALIYCLNDDSLAHDLGEWLTRKVYDRYAEPHWVSWSIHRGSITGGPRLCSESPTPFAVNSEPYTTERKA